VSYIKETLPITGSSQNELYMDPNEARILGNKLADYYCSNKPFPHIVIDDFLPLSVAEELLHSFPKQEISEYKYIGDTLDGLYKIQTNPDSCNFIIRSFFHFFNSSSVLQFLESLTRINALIGDPYYAGGGLHEIFRGGKLGIHSDFRIQQNLHLNRRINILIYLNKNWENDYGGNLELWETNMQTRMHSIAPIFNRCVIFNTDSNSYHGHPDPLNTPQEISRKSIALYYYTASKYIYFETPKNSTTFFSRSNDSFDVKKHAYKLRLNNHLQEWLPPIALRALYRIKKIISFNK
jgi:Rps23 Pro-64 3,4-dihydroxylase Tpa1-like proline 4-hydroxylase